MRALVLFVQYPDDTEAIEPIGIMSELVWENYDEDLVEKYWDAMKREFAVHDLPDRCFREAWLTLYGWADVFAEVEIQGHVEVDDEL